MKKVIILVFALLVCGFNPIYAQNLSPQPKDVKDINSFMAKFLNYSNDHNINGIKKLYAPGYVSGDGIKKDDLISMIKESWDIYSDIRYASDVKDIRVNNNTATVETFDSATSIAGKKSAITDDPGTLESCSHNIMYLQKLGKEWKITSDRVNYERTTIKYGTAKNINMKFSAPEQVFAGQEYTATLYTDIPARSFALGSITNEPIVYPQTKAQEAFRQILPDTNFLERVFKANTTNNNELTSASIGFTDVIENNPDDIGLKLSGLAVLLQRVNVIPKSTYIAPCDKKTDSTEENDATEENKK